MYLAVDIGGTKVLLSVFTSEGKIIESLKFATPKDYPELITEFDKNVKTLKTKDFKLASVAVPGRLDREHGIALVFGSRSWKNVHIARDIESKINCPVIIENDAKLAALSEGFYLKDEFSKVLYVTISTGISAGLVVNGILDSALIHSESGHMVIEHNGKLQRWEDFASGKAIVAKYGKKASEITDQKAWIDISRNIAIGLIELVAVIQPDVIVLGGGVGAHFDKYKKYLDKELAKFNIPMAPVPPVIMAKHPEEAVVYGCYLLAKERSRA